MPRSQPLVFAVHLANWEIPALAPHAFGFKTSILYRRPNIGAASNAIVAMRERCMGTMVAAGLDAPLKLGRALESGGTVAHAGRPAYEPGVDVDLLRPLGQGESAGRRSSRG